jgi:pimeloyl-ACP methyl ester carboxylesterase
VLIHGLVTPMYSWDALSSALTGAGFRVLRYDHLGRGLSDRPPVRYDPALYTRQLVELLRSLSIDATHVVGWSRGCLIGARLALEMPDAVHRLVMIAPGMFVAQPMMVRVVSRLPVVGRAILARSATTVIARLPAEHLEHPDRFPDYAARMREQTAHPGLGESFASTVIHYPWGSGPELAEAGRHSRPVQLVWGDHDPATPYRNAARVRAIFPRAELVTVAGARHAPHVEHAARVHPAIVEFLRRDAFASLDAPAPPRPDVIV